MRRGLLTASLFALTFASSQAADWPQWRGPNRDGKSEEKGLQKVWPKEGPKLLWKVTTPETIGTGYGSPAIVGDKLYILGGTTAKQDSQHFVACLNTKDGTPVWKKEIDTNKGGYNDGWGGGPRATPTVSDGMVYVVGPTGDVVCLTADKGDVKWSKSLVKDFKGKIPTWGYSESVLVDGDAVVVTPGADGGVVKLNKKTGEVIWQCTEVKDGAGYSSIMIAEVGGVKQYVQQTMAHGIGIRAKDGKLLWSVGDIKRKVAVIPSPVISGEFVFYTAGYGAGCETFKLEAAGEGTKATKIFSNTTLQNHHGGVIGIGDHIFGHSDSGGWMCLPFKSEAEPLWKNGSVGKGSIAMADGLLYFYSENDGTIALVEPNTTSYKEISRFKIPEKSKLRPNSGKVWAHPVIADGKLFLRDYEFLYVYDLKNQGS